MESQNEMKCRPAHLKGEKACHPFTKLGIALSHRGVVLLPFSQVVVLTWRWRMLQELRGYATPSMLLHSARSLSFATRRHQRGFAGSKAERAGQGVLLNGLLSNIKHDCASILCRRQQCLGDWRPLFGVLVSALTMGRSQPIPWGKTRASENRLMKTS